MFRACLKHRLTEDCIYTVRIYENVPLVMYRAHRPCPSKSRTSSLAPPIRVPSNPLDLNPSALDPFSTVSYC